MANIESLIFFFLYEQKEKRGKKKGQIQLSYSKWEPIAKYFSYMVADPCILKHIQSRGSMDVNVL